MRDDVVTRMDEQDLRRYVRVVLENFGEPMTAKKWLMSKKLLQKIDNGPYHSMPVDELSPDELEAAEVLAMNRMLRRMPADRRFPERFVLTSTGSHKTGTFAVDKLHDEEGDIRRARRAGTLKTTKW